MKHISSSESKDVSTDYNSQFRVETEQQTRPLYKNENTKQILFNN